MTRPPGSPSSDPQPDPQPDAQRSPDGEWGWPQDDATVDLLRGALRRQADAVRPAHDGLTRILAAARDEAAPHRPARPHAPRRPVVTHLRRVRRWLPVAAAAAAVLGVTTGGLALVNSTSPSAAEPAAFVTDQPLPPPVAPLPVYFVQKQGTRWALVREFEPTTITDPNRRLQAAVRFAVDGRAMDPDYTSVWRAKGLAGDVTTIREADRLSIVLTSDLLGRESAAAPDPALAALAVQQLVWTATAVTQLNVPVEVHGDTTDARLLKGLQLDTTFQRGTGTRDKRAPVWISTLAQDQGLRVGTATISGDAVAVANARVRWTLRRTDEPTTKDPVAQGTTDLSTIAATAASAVGAPTGASPGAVAVPPAPGQRGTWKVTVPLPKAGRYELTVEQPWPDGGGDAWKDTKAFRVS